MGNLVLAVVILFITFGCKFISYDTPFAIFENLDEKHYHLNGLENNSDSIRDNFIRIELLKGGGGFVERSEKDKRTEYYVYKRERIKWDTIENKLSIRNSILSKPDDFENHNYVSLYNPELGWLFKLAPDPYDYMYTYSDSTNIYYKLKKSGWVSVEEESTLPETSYILSSHYYKDSIIIIDVFYAGKQHYKIRSLNNDTLELEYLTSYPDTANIESQRIKFKSIDRFNPVLDSNAIYFYDIDYQFRPFYKDALMKNFSLIDPLENKVLFSKFEFEAMLNFFNNNQGRSWKKQYKVFKTIDSKCGVILKNQKVYVGPWYDKIEILDHGKNGIIFSCYSDNANVIDEYYLFKEDVIDIIK